MISKIARRQIVGSHPIALNTTVLLRKMVHSARWKTAQELMDKVRDFARILPEEPLVIENIVRHVLWIIREEFNELDSEGTDGLARSQSTSLQDLASAAAPAQPKTPDFNKPLNVMGPIMEHIGEFMEEVNNTHVDIAKQACDHIHANEVVMTLGRSSTVERFIKEVSKQGRPIEVIVCEAAPDFSGHEFAVSLASKGCKTTLVSDAAIFAMMARVNKVIIGAHAVMANGGIIAHAGTQAVALAAKQHSVPVVVCTGLYKLSPRYPSDMDSLLKLENPSPILPFDAEVTHSGVELFNPAFDYIAPELVSLFITDKGGYSPSYIYRLIAQQYCLEDDSQLVGYDGPL